MKTVPASSPRSGQAGAEVRPGAALDQLSGDGDGLQAGADPVRHGLLFKVKPPPIPMKGFSDEASAKEWLRQFAGTERRTARN